MDEQLLVSQTKWLPSPVLSGLMHVRSRVPPGSSAHTGSLRGKGKLAVTV